jgi:hypothetical protein
MTIDEVLRIDRLQRNLPHAEPLFSNLGTGDDIRNSHEGNATDDPKNDEEERVASTKKDNSDRQRHEADSSPVVHSVLGTQDAQYADDWNQRIAADFHREMKVVAKRNYLVGLHMEELENGKVPVINIQTEQEISAAVKEHLQHFVDSLRLGRAWTSVKFQFFIGPLRKSASSRSTTPWLDSDRSSLSSNGNSSGNQHDERPPQRRQFSLKPEIGSSIGIKGFPGVCGHTTTLSAFLDIDGAAYALTVNHLFTKCDDRACNIEEDANYDITQPSQEDIHLVDQWIWKLRVQLFHSMDDGDIPLQEQLIEKYDRAVAISAKFHTEHDRIRFGKRAHASGKHRTRVSPTGNHTQMDWSLCKIHPDRVNHNIFNSANDGDSDQSIYGPSDCSRTIFGYGPYQPGELVHAVGRTSGYQVGQINAALYLCDFEGVQTWECGIGKPSGKNSRYAHYWDSTGPFGQSGDSGALVVSMTTNEARGLVWGRRSVDGYPVAIFTPLEMVFDDIRGKCSAESIRLLTPRLSPRSLSSCSEETTESLFDVEAGNAESDNTSVFSMSVPGTWEWPAVKGVKAWDDDIMPQQWLPLL